MHRRLGSATLSQLAFPGEGNPDFPWEKSHWDNVKKRTLEPISCVAVGFHDCTGGLVVEVFDESDKVGSDVVLLHGCCMPNPVEGLLYVYEDMVEVLLVLEVFLTEDS